jgi:hypothetical protein
MLFIRSLSPFGMVAFIVFFSRKVFPRFSIADRPVDAPCFDIEFTPSLLVRTCCLMGTFFDFLKIR